MLDRSGCPSSLWLLCLLHVCLLLNHSYNWTLSAVPLTLATGSTPDISMLLRFYWWEPVYYRVDESSFPSDSREERGRFVGVSSNVGHRLTFKVLCDRSARVLHRSSLRSASTTTDPNLRLDPINSQSGETDPNPVNDAQLHTVGDKIADENDLENGIGSSVLIDLSDLIGRTFLMDEQSDGTRQRARIMELIDDFQTNATNDQKKFKVQIGEDNLEEILTYNEVMDYIEKRSDSDDGEEIYWKYKRLSGHQGPLGRDDPNWKGDRFNVQVEWENGEITYEPLRTIAADDPVACAIYARDNNLLDTPGWKRFKRTAMRSKKMLRMINQSKMKSFRTSKKYMYGYEVPRDYKDAMRLDKLNGNLKWTESIKLEMVQLHEYDTFADKGLGYEPGSDFQKIKVHLVFAVKHDGRHKARLCANGNLTDELSESVYSGVVSLRGLRLVVFLAELNNQDVWATDIGNAYLEARTSEKVYIIAGPEFAELEGHTLVIFKALYGLRSSGKRWFERFAECLIEMKFMPCKVEGSVWMRRVGNLYEYIAVYVDDLAIVSKNPASITDTLQKKYKFKLKGTGPISFHLGCDFYRDDTGILCAAPKKYIQKISESYLRIFGERPKTKGIFSPLVRGDHPEIDDSDFLNDEGITNYQSLIGQLQWAISLGCFDLSTAVMSMSSFRSAPRIGHMDRVRRMVGYICKMDGRAIRYRTEMPDLSEVPENDYDWQYSVYGNVEEVKPDDIPVPLGKPIVTVSFVDANLAHCALTGRSVTGVLHLINKTPFDWYAKKQSTVNTATYGSEFVAARTCTEQIMDIRVTLWYLGVNILRSVAFGDNESVVNSSMIPEGKLHKRHLALSYHQVREAIAAKVFTFTHMNGKFNPADMLSKHWGYQQIWKYALRPLLFWKGDTSNLIEDSEE